MLNITIVINGEENKKRKLMGTQTKNDGGSDNYHHDVIFIKKIPTHRRERLKLKTVTLRCWLLFFQMDLAKYEIYEKNDEKLKSLIERNHGKRNYYICQRICELATNSFVVSYEISSILKLMKNKMKMY